MKKLQHVSLGHAANSSREGELKIGIYRSRNLRTHSSALLSQTNSVWVTAISLSEHGTSSTRDPIFQ